MTDETHEIFSLRRALRYLRIRRRRHVPHVQSLTATDCGSACVAMVCEYYGKRITVEAAREALGTGRDGTTLLGLLQGARDLGLRARALRVELDGLRFLRTGTILFWNFNHFVVFESRQGKRVRVIDPSLGPREIELERFRKSFSGFCIELEPGETFVADDQRQKSTSRVLQYLAASTSNIGWVAVLSLVLQGLLLTIPAVTGLVIDTLVPQQDTALLAWLIGGAVSVALFVAAAEYVRQLLLVVIRTRLDVDMSMKFLEHLLRLPFGFFQVRQSGDLMARMNSMAFIRQLLSSSAVSALLDGSLVVVYLLLIALASPALSLAIGCFVAIRASILVATYRRQKQLMAEELERQALLRGFQVEMLEGMESIKASAIEEWVAERWSSLYVDATNVFVARSRLDAVSTAVRKGIEIGGPLATLLLGAHLVISGGLSLGTMFTVVALSGMVFLPLDQLFQTGVDIARLKSFMERIDDVLDVAPEQEPGAVRRLDRLRGEIRVESLDFRYSRDDKPVLDGLDFVIEPKTTVAFVGRTGSGKSTLGKLLLGLYTPGGGKILYDGEDLRQLDLRTVRRQLGAVAQTPAMLDGSLRDNIAPSGETPLEEVVRAAKIANIHSEIMAMPMRYETRVVTGGTAFSGGQKQRIAIARAVVRRPAVLLLDEATSSLDTVTEAMVHARLSELPLTLVIIAHRLSTVRHADCIHVLEAGRIVESGTHEELLAKRGYYLDLIKHQLARDSAESAALSNVLSAS